MAYEILSVKLCELDEKTGRFRSRIHLCESAQHGQVKKEIEALQKECRESGRALEEKLRFSRAQAVSRLSEAYSEIQQIIKNAWKLEKKDLPVSEVPTESQMEFQAESEAEEKILLAEYALDFAMQAANQALLASLEAIDAQMTWQEEEEEML